MRPDTLLAAYPVVVPVRVAWGDMDAFQHVNNTVYFRWFEDARIAFFEEVGWLAAQQAGGPGPILARTQAVFQAPVAFPDTVHVGARADGLGDDRFTMQFAVASEAQGRIVAEGDGRIVSFDYAKGRKANLPDDVRRAIERLDR